MNTETTEMAVNRPQFEIVGEGMVSDHNTGLTWMQSDLGDGRMNDKDAILACAELDLGGHTDWRLPTRHELLSLVDIERHDPAINTKFFPDCKSFWYRTNTPYAPSPGDCAWNVNFDYGNANWFNRDLSGFVRAVRGCQ